MADIRLQDVSVSYGNKQVLKNISLTIHDGECCTLLGPSACGKTTLARAICGFNKLDSGEIYLGDNLVSSKPKKHLQGAREKEHRRCLPRLCRLAPI